MTDINFLCTFLPETPISKHYIMGSASAIWNVFWCFLLSQIVIIKLSRRQFVNLSIRRVVIGGCLALQIPIFFSILSVHFLPLLHFLYIMHRRRTVQRRALPIDRLWSLKMGEQMMSHLLKAVTDCPLGKAKLSKKKVVTKKYLIINLDIDDEAG